MAKASQTIISQSSKKTMVSITPKPSMVSTPKFIPGTEETNGIKRCPNCGKFMR